MRQNGKSNSLSSIDDYTNQIMLELEDDLNNWEEQECFLDDLAEFEFLNERLDDDW